MSTLSFEEGLKHNCKLDYSGVQKSLESALLIYGESALLRDVQAYYRQYEDDLLNAQEYVSCVEHAAIVAIVRLIVDVRDLMLSDKKFVARSLSRMVKAISVLL